MSGKSCPFCGVSALSLKEGVVVYGCSTSIHSHQVLRSVTCVARERDILRQRVDTAVAAMSQLREISTLCGQRAVMAHEVRGIRQALQGNSPINLEGSDG